MVSNKIVYAANAQLPQVLPDGLTAVFIGATSGIGQKALEQFSTATKDKSPHIYVVGRNASAAASLIAKLRLSNASAAVEFIEQDVSLVRSVDAVADVVRHRENKLDLLFLSPGFIPFEGRKETSEGLEPSMTTRYYSRVRAIQLFIDLLDRSDNPHVCNILAGGQESPLVEDDLDLKTPSNFSFIKASAQSATMLTMMLERFAAEHPRISFVHAFPGLTATPTLTRGSSGIAGFLLQWIISPVVNALFAASADDVGAKALFYATNARYTVSETASQAVPLPHGLSTSKQTSIGVFLVDAQGEGVGDEKLLGDLRSRLGDTVWSHTQQIFDGISKSKPN